MAKLFLSYAREDAPVVRRLAHWLGQEGHEVWWDEDIGGGASFSAEIEKALAQSDAVLALWSAKSVQSPWVRDEAAIGRELGKLVPLSLDGSEPPLGFRQFQTIGLAKWKGRGAPSEAERLRKAIARIAPAPAAAVPLHEAQRPRQPVRPGALGMVAAAAAAALLLVIGITGLVIWDGKRSATAIRIAVSASPTSSDASAAADYANVAAAELASYLPSRFENATVIGPAEVDGDTGGYHMRIAAGRHEGSADASLTLSDSDGRSILWSKSWSQTGQSAADLKEKVSQAVSQAALCLAKARGGPTRIDQPALGLYVSACTSLFDPNTSDAQLLTTSERVVKLAPKFAEGWASVAMGRALYAESLQARSGTPDPRALRSAREAIATARKLDPRSGFPYLAEWHLVRDDPLQGLALLDKAIKVDPDEPVLYARLSNSLMAVGRMTDAVAAARRAAELDPFWSFTRESYINALTYAGQFSRAAADIADARRKWPANREIDLAELEYHYLYGDPRVARRLIASTADRSDAEMAPDFSLVDARIDPIPAKIDAAIEAARARAAIEPRTGNRRLLLALAVFGRTHDIYRLLRDPAFQSSVEPALLFRPEFAHVRADPRFMAVAARKGLVRYWRQSGSWPDFCTSEQLGYECKAEAAKYA